MIVINQTMLTAAGLKEAEACNHKGATEYIPNAKETDYLTLTRGNPALFLSIKLVSPNDNSKEHELIESNTSIPVLVYSNRVLSKYVEQFQYELLSVSYQPSLNTLKSEGILVNALLILDDEEAMQLSEEAVRRIENEISYELGLIEEAPLNLNDEIHESKPVKSTLLEIFENDEIDETDEENVDIIEENDSVHTSKIDDIELAQRNFEENQNQVNETIIEDHSENNQVDFKEEDDDDDNDEDLLALKQKFEKEKAALRKKKEQERLEQERLEKERLEQERLEQERLEQERLEQERLEQERLKQERLEQERLTKERLEQERLEKERLEHERLEQKRIEDEKKLYNSTIVGSFYKGVHGKDNISEEQLTAYQNATNEKPFLNNIDSYVPETHLIELEGLNPEYEIYEEDAFIQTTASKNMLDQSFHKTLTYFMENEHTSLCRVLRGEIEMESFIKDIEIYIDKHLKIPIEDKDLFMDRIKRAFFSYYVLTPAINDKNVSDIRVLAPDNINIKVHGDHYTAKGLKFIHANDYMRFIEALIIKNRIYIGENTNIIVFTDKDYHPDYILRFNLCLPAINSTGLPYLHIRKVPKKKTTLADLIRDNMLDEKIASYLLDKVSTSKGIIFSGPSASGKTTLMNALVDYIPKKKSILCIQESEELFSNVHPNAYFQHMLKDVHGQTIIGLSELGTNGLLCDSGYFIIGECKGSEARDLLRASNTGHNCWCSIHAQSANETIPRLADYVKLGADYSFDEAVRMLKDLDVIVYIQNYKVKEISEIAGYDEENKRIIYRPIYRNPFFDN